MLKIMIKRNAWRCSLECPYMLRVSGMCMTCALFLDDNKMGPWLAYKNRNYIRCDQCIAAEEASK
jgi:hypothetical protein